MTKSEAVETYLAHTSRPSRIVDKLMRWNPNSTLEENGRALGMKLDTVYMFARKHKLLWVRPPRGGGRN